MAIEGRSSERWTQTLYDSLPRLGGWIGCCCVGLFDVEVKVWIDKLRQLLERVLAWKSGRGKFEHPTLYIKFHSDPFPIQPETLQIGRTLVFLVT